MKKLGPISLPQDHPQEYSRRLSVMLYQYLRDIVQQVNALIDASGSSSGASAISSAATLTVPASSFYHEETVAFVGCTSSMKIVCSLAPHDDADENSEELLNVVSMSADAGTDSAIVNIAFSDPTTGAVKINMMAV